MRKSWEDMRNQIEQDMKKIAAHYNDVYLASVIMSAINVAYSYGVNDAYDKLKGEEV